MNYLEAALEISRSVYRSHLSLASVGRNFFAQQQFTKEEQKQINGLISCEMHHHLAIIDTLAREDITVDADLEPILWHLLANAACYHHFPQAEMLALAGELFTQKESAFPEAELRELLKRIDEPKDLIAPEYEEDSSEYLGLRYNTPLWLVKMWRKHLGSKVASKLLHANRRRMQQIVRINPMQPKQKREILAFDQDFIEGPADNTLIYRARANVKRHPLFLEKAIFQQRGAISHILSELDYTLLGNCLIYEERPQAVYLDVALYSLGKLKMDVAVSNERRRLDINKTSEAFGLKNVFAFVSRPESLITQIRDEYHLVIVMPSNSAFDLIRTVPDFFVHFEQSQLDHYLTLQNRALEECRHFLAPGGKMLYLINTVSQKEGHGIIVEFLKQHRDLHLIKERQFLPFDRFNTALYVAILERETSAEDHEDQPL